MSFTPNLSENASVGKKKYVSPGSSSSAFMALILALAGAISAGAMGICDGTSCETCVGEHHAFGDCRWCEQTRSCHSFGSLLNQCRIPLHGPTWTCMSKDYPYQMQAFSPNEVATWGTFIQSIVPLIAHERTPFKEVPAGRTLRWDAHTRAELADGAMPAASDEEIRISVTADWGAGTMEADAVGAGMAGMSPHYTVHMGDVYFSARARGAARSSRRARAPESRVTRFFRPIARVCSGCGG